MADDGSAVVGICQTMCPLDELKLREREGLLHMFEVIESTRQNKRPSADVDKTVKEYSRPAAGRKDLCPHQLRPVDVLMKTVDYLVNCVLTKTNVNFDVVYHYVFNRLRAVRQDMVIQRIDGLQAIYMLEKIAGFHILAGYKLCEANASVFDAKINETHTRECLKRLLVLYDSSRGPHDRRVEFEGLYLLYCLGDTEAILHCLSLPTTIRHCKAMQLCFQVTSAYLEKNYVRFNRLAQHLPPLASCAISRHFAVIRRQALCIMSHGYSSKNLKYPFYKLQNLLDCDSPEQVKSYCEALGISIVNGGVVFIKGSVADGAKVVNYQSRSINCKLERETIPTLLNGTREY